LFLVGLPEPTGRTFFPLSTETVPLNLGSGVGTGAVGEPTAGKPGTGGTGPVARVPRLLPGAAAAGCTAVNTKETAKATINEPANTLRRPKLDLER
jgi:hypothetical protein